MPKLSEQEYVQRIGQVCPVCESSDIKTRGAVDTDSDYGWQRIECSNCSAEWDDVYKLIGYSFSTLTEIPKGDN